MNNISDNDNDNSHIIHEYFENSDHQRRNQHKFRDFDNFNNKNSICTFLTSIIEGNHDFLLSSLTPEEILKIYNCYVSNETFSIDNDSDTNNNQSNNKTDEVENLLTVNEDNANNDHFQQKSTRNNINILDDIETDHHADAREFIFSFFELVNLPLLSTQAFSIMVINGSSDEEQLDLNQNYDTQTPAIANHSLSSILFNKFLANTGSLEVFLDHYTTLINPSEAKTYKTNKNFIESRILQIKSITTIITHYPSHISRMSKIIKKFSPFLFSLLKQSDISTAIEAFRCIVSIYNCKLNIIKKKTRRKWLPKIINSCTPDSILFPLIMNFATNQNKIKFELSAVADKVIDKSTLYGNKRKNILKKQNIKEVDDYQSCSEFAPYEDSYFGICTIETLNSLESILIEISNRNNKLKKSRKILSKHEESDPENQNDAAEEPNQIDNEQDESSENPSSVQQSLTYLFNVAIEDSIFGKAAVEVIRNFLISVSQHLNLKKPNTKLEDDDDDEDDDSEEICSVDDDSTFSNGIFRWSIFLIRKSIIMFAISEKSDNFMAFERRCHCITNMCIRLCEKDDNGASVSEYLIESIKRIVRAALIGKKDKNTNVKKKSNQVSIVQLAKSLNIDINIFKEEDVDESTRKFLKSMTSDLLEAEELTLFVHFPFDDAIDDSLMQN